jgi:hypothetical protein
MTQSQDEFIDGARVLASQSLDDAPAINYEELAPVAPGARLVTLDRPGRPVVMVRGQGANATILGPVESLVND